MSAAQMNLKWIPDLTPYQDKLSRHVHGIAVVGSIIHCGRTTEAVIYKRQPVKEAMAGHGPIFESASSANIHAHLGLDTSSRSVSTYKLPWKRINVTGKSARSKWKECKESKNEWRSGCHMIVFVLL